VDVARHLGRPWSSDRSLTILLAFLVINVFLLYPLGELGVLGHLAYGIAFTLILISGGAATAKRRAVMVAFSAVAFAALVLHWARFAAPTPALVVADAVASMVACGMLAAIVLVQVFREGPMTVHRIQGAVAVYLLLALVWAFAYGVIAHLVPGAFHSRTGPVVDAPVLAAQRYLYFSFVTLTTVGYGDVTAVYPLARSLAMFEAFVGQLFPAILIARLVSMELYYRQRRFEREQAVLDREALAREMARPHPERP
jgi:voltage-gated potassium channel Kch